MTLNTIMAMRRPRYLKAANSFAPAVTASNAPPLLAGDFNVVSEAGMFLASEDPRHRLGLTIVYGRF